MEIAILYDAWQSICKTDIQNPLVRESKELKIEPQKGVKTQLAKDINPIEPESLLLDSFFNSISHYRHIMQLIVNEGLIEPVTFFWKYKKGSTKGYLVGILRTLHLRGFLKKKLKEKEIVRIAQSTFGVTLSKSLAKQAQYSQVDMEFIPYENTIPR